MTSPKSAAGFAVVLTMLSIVFKEVRKESPSLEVPPSKAQQESEYYQCTRQCQWFYGIRQDIIGKLALGECKCFNGTTQLAMDKPAVPHFTKKYFDSQESWGGGVDENGEEYGFDTDLVCTQAAGGTLQTMRRAEAEAIGAKTLHCGACAACSAPSDIEVLSRTRTWITEVMTRVGADYAAPWGHGNTTLLAENLVEVGFNMSRVRHDGREDLPTCMDCWIDDITCAAKTCKQRCWIKFFNPANPKLAIAGAQPGVFDFNGQCLKCDEDNCVPHFLKCAGANRRSAGIVSDIPRPAREVCSAGMYSNTPAKELPTSLQPSSAFVREVLSRRWGSTSRRWA